MTQLEGHVPLFNTLLNYRYSLEVTGTGAGMGDLGVKLVGAQERTNYPLSLSVDDLGESFELTIQVSDQAGVSAESILGYVENALRGLLRSLDESIDLPVGEINILSGEERALLASWNETKFSYPGEKCIHELFERQVAQYPDNVAVVFEDKTLTYRELNEQANQLAHYLVDERGVKPDELVGICLERSTDMIVAILGILKAGGAYVPLDPTYPVSRLRYMVSDASLDTIITSRDLPDQLGITAGQGVITDSASFTETLSRYSKSNIAVEDSGLHASHLAYVIYTSGSTGQPKGTLLCHQGLVNMCLAQISTFQITNSSRVLQFASMSFDAATSEWCMGLVSGASLYGASKEVLHSPALLGSFVSKHQLSHALLPPSLLASLEIAHWKNVGTLIVGGEACSLEQAERWSEGRAFFNAYGPSEATVIASVYRKPAGALSSGLPIGKPISNTELYVLDRYGRQLPIGIPGELHIGGAGLAREYLNRPELTAERFIQNPLRDDPSERLYKTGDLVKYLPDGNLVFLGRMDTQVKLRGFRIELGEVEDVLSR